MFGGFGFVVVDYQTVVWTSYLLRTCRFLSLWESGNCIFCRFLSSSKRCQEHLQLVLVVKHRAQHGSSLRSTPPASHQLTEPLLPQYCLFLHIQTWKLNFRILLSKEGIWYPISIQSDAAGGSAPMGMFPSQALLGCFPCVSLCPHQSFQV